MPYALALYLAKITCMEPTGLTSEFSICLLPDTKATQDIEVIRQILPISPRSNMARLKRRLSSTVEVSQGILILHQTG